MDRRPGAAPAAARRRRARLPRPLRHHPGRPRPGHRDLGRPAHREVPGRSPAAGSPGSTGSARACCPTRETRHPGGRPAPPGDARGERRPRLRGLRPTDRRTTDARRHRRSRCRRPLDRPRADRQRSRGAAHRQGPRRRSSPSGCPTPSGCSPTPASCPRSRRPGSSTATWSSPRPATTRPTWSPRCWPRPSSAVPRTVGRVNHPNNEWLFTEAWGVDVNVSTPRIMSALVEEAVTVGDLVRLFTFRQGNANLVEMTLPEDSPYVGKPVGPDPVPGELRAGDDPARRAGLHARRRAADRGRRRAAVRRRRRGRGPSSRSCSPPPSTTARAGRAGDVGSRSAVSAGSTGVWLRASSQTIAASAGDLQRPAHRDLADAERGDRRARRRSAAPCRRARSAACTTTPQHARQRQQPGQAAAQPHHLRVAVPRGRVAGDAADHEADQRPARSGMLSTISAA